MTDLPPVLQEIAEAAGLEAALKLAEQYGGQRVRIPGRLRPNCWLTDCVGQVAAEKIVAHYLVLDADGRPRGIELVLPIAHLGSFARARRQIREAFSRALESGSSVRAAARQAGVTERAGWKMKRRMGGEGEDGQGSLF